MVRTTQRAVSSYRLSSNEPDNVQSRVVVEVERQAGVSLCESANGAQFLPNIHMRVTGPFGFQRNDI